MFVFLTFCHYVVMCKPLPRSLSYHGSWEYIVNFAQSALALLHLKTKMPMKSICEEKTAK